MDIDRDVTIAGWLSVIILLGAAAGLLMLFDETAWRSGKIVGDAVWFHESNRYSLSYEINGKLYNKEASSPGIHLQVLTDLKKGEKPYYEYKYYWSSIIGTIHKKEEYSRLHIHSIDNIKGAGWNHGKFGTGQTIRIQ